MSYSRPITIKCLTFSFSRGGFSDFGNEYGYIDGPVQLPANAVVLYWKAVITTGFTGDTTATIGVGCPGAGTMDSTSTTARFTRTPNQSVLAAGTLGSVPTTAATTTTNSYLSTATTVRIHVKGSADFTAISAGAGVLSIYYQVI